MTTQEWQNLRIDERRFRDDFEALSAIGKTGETGINRTALSEAHLAARNWFRQKIEGAGLRFSQDSAGNHHAYLPCGPTGVPSLLMGSHLDSVATGGRYDGALGVLAALEVLRTVREAGLRLPVNLEAIDFTDEEGTLVSFLGSFAFSGQLTEEQLSNPRGDPTMLEERLLFAGLSHGRLLSARRDPKTLAGYLELHVEQGPRLFDMKKRIGIVTDISGIVFYRLTFKGRADHAGSTPVNERLDASLGASAFILALHDLIASQFPDCYANVGDAKFEPGAYNIVPERVTLAVEFRSATDSRIEVLRVAILDQARREANRFNLSLEIEFLGERRPVQTSSTLRTAIQRAAKHLGLSSIDMISYAGHDAQAVAALCPVGMIFVPSVNGRSHTPEEYTPWEDCVNGANVLLHAVVGVAMKWRVL